MDVVNVLFLVGLLHSRKTRDTLKHMEWGRMVQCVGVMQELSNIYKNVRARSINVVMAMI